MDSVQNNTDTFHPEIYVVAVCRNEERYIENFILSLIRSSYPVHIVHSDYRIRKHDALCQKSIRQMTA